MSVVPYNRYREIHSQRRYVGIQYQRKWGKIYRRKCESHRRKPRFSFYPHEFGKIYVSALVCVCDCLRQEESSMKSCPESSFGSQCQTTDRDAIPDQCPALTALIQRRYLLWATPVRCSIALGAASLNVWRVSDIVFLTIRIKIQTWLTLIK